MSKQISYLLDDAQVKEFLAKPELPDFEHEDLNVMEPNLKKTIIKNAVDKYTRHSARYEKNKLQLPLDYYSYLAIILEFLSDNLMVHISFIRANATLTIPEKISEILEYLYLNYGPNNTNDVVLCLFPALYAL
jgi:hypothetical protein